MIEIGNTATHNDQGAGDTFAFDSGSGSNRILIIGFANYDETVNDRQVSAITYGGQSLTKHTASVADNATDSGRSELWYLINPPTGSNNVAITFAGANDIANSDLFLAIFTGVDQGTPIDTGSGSTTVQGTQDRITLTTTIDDCMLVDVNNGNAGPMTIGAGQTSLLDASGSTGRGSYKLVAGAGNYNMDMDRTANDDFAHSALALTPYVAPPIATGNFFSLFGL